MGLPEVEGIHLKSLHLALVALLRSGGVDLARQANICPGLGPSCYLQKGYASGNLKLEVKWERTEG